LARKRKKSKVSRASRTKRPKSGDEPPAEASAETPSSDASSSSGVDAVIEISDEIDDAQARERLIAAVAGMASDADDEPSDHALSQVDPEDDEAQGSADAGGFTSRGTDAEPSDAPVMGPDVLVALRELRREGIASIGEELILDLGEAATPEDRDRLLAATLAHAEMREAIYRVPAESRRARRWKTSMAGLVLLAAAWVAAFPPAFLVPDRPRPLSEADQLRGIRAALLLKSQQIEAFRAREGRLPDDLSQTGAPVADILYVKPNNRLYQLIGYTSRGEAVVYDSSAPGAAFEAVGVWWAGDGGRP